MVGRRTRGRIYPLVNWVAGSYPALEPWCGRLQQSKVVLRGLVCGRGVCLVAAIAYRAVLTKACIVSYRTAWYRMVSSSSAPPPASAHHLEPHQMTTGAELEEQEREGLWEREREVE